MNLGLQETLTEDAVKALLRDYGIPTTDFVVIESDNDLESIELEFPVALKVCSPDILHKTDVGGVELNIMDEEELKREFSEFKKKFPGERFIIEKMESQGIEMIAGLVNDASFGMSIMVGMGGIFAEMYKDVSFRLVPIKRKDAEEMIDDLKAGELFKGFRGIELDRKAMVELLLKLSQIGTDFPSISQMDLNPVFVYSSGLKVIDAKMIKIR
ncbi:MAG TPA: acetyl-CoA synthetase [Thermoplasmatales archaeon]|nr:acetyl-CoA synthetase [Thermoplasmatales archaeon]